MRFRFLSSRCCCKCLAVATRVDCVATLVLCYLLFDVRVVVYFDSKDTIEWVLRIRRVTKCDAVKRFELAPGYNSNRASSLHFTVHSSIHVRKRTTTVITVNMPLPLFNLPSSSLLISLPPSLHVSDQLIEEPDGSNVGSDRDTFVHSVWVLEFGCSRKYG